MARTLRNIKITEVSSVDKGAGEGVKVMLMKRDGSAAPLNGEIEMTDDELKALIKKSNEEAVATLTKSFEGQIGTLKTELNIAKMSAAHKAYLDGCDEATQKSFADMDEKGRDDFMAKNPKKRGAEPATADDLQKRDTELAKMATENADLRKRLDAFDLREQQAEFKKRAADAGLTAEGDGELMRKAYAGDKEAQTAFEKRQQEVLTAARAQADTSIIFKEFGGAGRVSFGKAYDELTAKAAELRKADTTLTQEQAFTKAYTDPANAEIVARYKAEEAKGRAQAA